MAAGRTEKDLQGVSLLGNKTKYRDDYAPDVLEYFPNKHPENDYFVKFNCPEFTSLCPKTGQPDFATIYHEDCVNIIMKDLIRLLDPKYIEVWGKFLPRGGLSIDPYANYGKKGTDWEKTAHHRLHYHDMNPETVQNR